MAEELSSHQRTGYTAEQPAAAGSDPDEPGGGAADPAEYGPQPPDGHILPGGRAGRRRRRQTITFLVIVGVVLSVGLVGLTYYYGLWGGGPSGTATACTPRSTAMPHNTVSVNVYNGSDRRGLAGTVSKQLKKRKFGVGKVDNDPEQQKVRGVAVIRYGPEGLLAARTMAAQLKGTPKLDKVDERTNDIIDVVLGAKYAGLRTEKDAAKQFARSAPKPAPGTCST